MRSSGLPALILSSDPSVWGSCQTITPNLVRAYELALRGRFTTFAFTPAMQPPEVWRLAERIRAANPSRLIFVDHAPHPALLIGALEEAYGHSLPPCDFHVYGDFTLYSRDWRSIESTLRSVRTRFICASPGQALLVRRFLSPGSRACVVTCPFPTDTQAFSPSRELRRAWRARLGIAEHEFLLVYAGRMSLQKNVIRLAREAIAFVEATQAPLRFVAAGAFDDLGAPFFGCRELRFSQFQEWRSYHGSLSPWRQDIARYVGALPSQALRGLYNAADGFTSLSLYHDEDYGLAPAEAICCGTPVLLSDWGGYSAFEQGELHGKPYSQKVPLRLDKGGLSIDSNEFRRRLLRMVFARFTDSERETLGALGRERLSIEAAAKALSALDTRAGSRFTGFSRLLRRHAESMTFAQGGALFPSGPKPGTFYEEIYGAYINPPASRP